MKAIVLVSGGLDSAVLLADVVKCYSKDDVGALNIRYGQKHSKERFYARSLAKHYGVWYNEIDLPQNIFAGCNCTLLQGNGEVEHSTYAEQLQRDGMGPVATYVPFRNGLFISVAAAAAMSVGAFEICYAAHLDDAAGHAYPDCSPEFYMNMQNAICSGTERKVKLVAPFLNRGYTKKDIVAFGHKMSVPFELTWSCYEGGEKPCGECATCRDRAAAFKFNGLADPALSKDNKEG